MSSFDQRDVRGWTAPCYPTEPSGWTAAHYPSGKEGIERMCSDAKRAIDFFFNELKTHVEELKRVPVPQEDIKKLHYYTAWDWIGAMKAHDCLSSFLPVDDPARNTVSYMCRRCETLFSIYTKDIRYLKEFYEAYFTQWNRTFLTKALDEKQPIIGIDVTPSQYKKSMAPYTVLVLDQQANVVFREQNLSFSVSHTRDVDVMRHLGAGDATDLVPVKGSDKTVITLGAVIPPGIPLAPYVSNIEGLDPRGATAPQGS